MPLTTFPSTTRAESAPSDFVEAAQKLAHSHGTLQKAKTQKKFFERLEKKGSFLRQCYQTVTEAVVRGEAIPPAEEWLIDNFHFIGEQIKAIQQDLPKKYYSELPCVTSGPLEGYPRVFEMASDLASYSDYGLDEEMIQRYMEAYQTVSNLKTGELWAFAIFLRFVLMENLAQLMDLSERHRKLESEAQQMLKDLDARGITLTDQALHYVEDRLPEERPERDLSIVHLILNGRSGKPETQVVVHALETRMLEAGFSIEEMIRAQNQEVAKAQVSTRNTVVSLRLLASIDWSKLIESTSAVDRVLREDPARLYEQCDFATRDRYRHVIEWISRRTKAFSEVQVAQEAVAFSSEALEREPSDLRRAHVGFYLVDEGRKTLEKRVGYQIGFFPRMQRFLEEEHAFLSYQFSVWLLTLFFVILILQYVAAYTTHPAWLIVSALLLFVPVSSLGLMLTNWLVTHSVAPMILPKLEWKEGIPSELKTMVVLPTVISDSTDIREAVAHLEIHYLANSDENLEFAVLSDYADSPTQTTPDDEKLLAEALTAISRLNKRHPRYPENRFHLLHRKRLWNEGEGQWMGWERKRGKLEELNRLLLGEGPTSFLNAKIPENVQFVITVDADTILPRDSIRKLVGTLAHPLNRPAVDPRTRHVAKGYGILQPRVSHTLTSANRSWFAKIVSGPSGIDPYTAAVSDVYQDLFQEASFVGKGIYDLRAFHDCLNNRFPENSLLSHDLIEGSYARTGLVTDVEIFDEHPSDYTSYTMRQHRWIRGDWQVSPWILPRVPIPDGSTAPNTLSALNRWKLIDNLRRSLVPPTLFLMLISGWIFLPVSPMFWNLIVLGILFTRNLVEVTSGLIFVTKSVSWIDHLKSHLRQSGLMTLHFLLRVAFLAHESFVYSDAIVRAVYRMKSKRRLLEWLRAAQAERLLKRHWSNYPEEMFGSIALTTFSSAAVFLIRSESILFAAPFLFAWAIAPFIAYLTGREIRRKAGRLTDTHVRQFRSYARDIWRYFDTFFTEEDHWLPPDNFQEVPKEILAHRTSPTNISFSLLANLVAYDFGFTGLTAFLDRTERTLNTLTRLSTFNGHLYNWYNTQTLQPLEPRYVSTVDSGNLAAALIVLKQFALTYPRTDPPFHKRIQGVTDTLRKMLERAKQAKVPSEQYRVIRELISFLRRTTGSEDQEDLLRWLNRVVLEMKPEFTADAEYVYWWNAVYRCVVSHLSDYQRPQDLKRRLVSIARECEEMVREMDYRFLFDEGRGLFSIGFNVTNGRLDTSYYDLLASEARLASFIAIAKGDVPQSHWFRMSRTMTSVGGERVLASWSGSMFEYLLPCLFLRSDKHTLLEETYEKAVRLQQRYGRARKTPWGMSEAAFHSFDIASNYQYGPFGVPWLGLKRGLSSSLVVAPYATFLCALLHPNLAARNLDALQRFHSSGRFGFYESIDFTPAHIPEKQEFAVVRAFMAHHLGMSLAAIDNVLHQNIMQKRFQSDPAIKSAALLLQERIPVSPRRTPIQVFDERPRLFRMIEPAVARAFDTPILYPPRTQLLSNGSFMTVVTSGGSGYSECNGIRLNRWREDPTLDSWGSYLYIKETNSGQFWSAGFQPTRKVPSFYQVHFMEDRVEIHRRDEEIETRLEIIVSPEDDVELRRLSLVNTSSKPIDLQVTSYCELVLTHPDTDLAHPAFSNLFVQTEYSEPGFLLAYRKPRMPQEQAYWASHTIWVEAENLEAIQHETDRSRFIGRNRSVKNPIALQSSLPLSNTTGAVLDPIFSLRCSIELPAYSRKVVCFSTAAAVTREHAAELALKYRDPRAIERTIEMAATHGQVLLRRLSISLEEAHLFQRVMGRLIFSDPSLRPRPSMLERVVGTQKSLWQYGISGDLPICLIRVEDPTELDIVRQLLRAHEYWRLKGFKSDLVILNEYPSSYFQHLQDDLRAAISASTAHALQDKPGGVFLLIADQMPEQDRTLMRAAARVQIVAERGSLAHQVRRSDTEEAAAEEFTPFSRFPIEDPSVPISRPLLKLENSLGGFSSDGKEYVIHLEEEQTTPAPWCNVICNENFGFQVSDSGAGMTWAINSRENRLTPWSNDAVCDPVDGALYIRDEESGKFWSATPSPARGQGTYQIAHGAGYTRFTYGGNGIEQQLLMFVPPHDPVKIVHLKLRNHVQRSRRLSVTYYSDLVLGVNKAQTTPFIVTAIDPETGALIATNKYSIEFADRITFLYVSDQNRTVSGDRTLFFGPEGSVQEPAAMKQEHLSGRVGAGLDPCMAMQIKITLAPLSEQNVIFLFGQVSDVKEIASLIKQYGLRKSSEAAFLTTQQHWDELLGNLEIHTPDPSVDVLLNRWLLYQAYTSRFWSRSAFYQSSGAFGFRDQLQDSLAFVYSRADITRNHLIYAASRQFVEGDVQHWWHPPSGRGVRTRCSDDLLWLPFCVAFYVQVTGNTSVLNEEVPFLTGKALDADLAEEYFQPDVGEKGNLYEHCIRAIEHSLRLGPHGLPLIGSGDWNDGMNRLGVGGRGESVWLAWFLIKILNDFAPICDARSDHQRAEKFRNVSQQIAGHIDEAAWDGQWYCRAFDDEGNPIGSNRNAECRIDSIAQSWAVLSGAGDPHKIEVAMQSVEQHLIRREESLMLLFTPPFEHTPTDPGYIKAYLPGIRENGGQYNHAAIWMLCAYCQLDQPENAYRVLQMINPLTRTASPEMLQRYRLEPYVVAADIYSHSSHSGNGGWSWYTGSAAWLYRAIVEYMLGLQLRNDRLTIKPCIPPDWPQFEIRYRRGKEVFQIRVDNPNRSGKGVRRLIYNGKVREPGELLLDKNESTHSIQIELL